MSNLSHVNDIRRFPTRRETPVWWLVCKWELGALWLGGHVLILLILFSVMMSITSVLQEAESQLSIIPPAEILFIALQSTITFGLFIGLIVGADAISGERERETLEALLLTPTSRVQIMVGKFLAALSPWPAAMLLSVPYLVMLARGDEILGLTLLLGAGMGTLLAVAFTALGMLISCWANSNRISLLASLLIYLFFLIPVLWPGVAQKGDLGYLLQQLNPMEGTAHFLEKVLVNNRTIEEKLPYAMSAILFAILIPGLLFLVAAPRLRLEGGAPRIRLPRRLLSGRSAAGLTLVACLILTLSLAAPIHAAAPSEDQPLQITIDQDHKAAKTGEKIEFHTVVTNTGTETSAPFHVSMNIIQIGSGDPVDPEDWSPERSQEVDPLEPGESTTLTWIVHTILEGNYMVYLTVVPTPDGPDSSSQTISSMGLHVVVNPSNNTNPGGVLPIAIVIPTVLILGTVLLRKRQGWGGKTDNAEA